MRRGNKPGLADERRLHLLLEARSCCRPRAAAPMSVAHTPSRYDPCTTGTDGALGARPCGGSDVEASPRQSCAARRLSVSNPWATHVGTIRSSPGPSPAHGVVQPGRVVVRGARAPTAPTAYGQNRAAYAPPAIVPARGHRLLRPSPAWGMREAARTSCCAARQERCRAKRRCQRGRRVASLLACAPRLTRLW